MAKEIKKDHALAMELWSSGRFLPRQLAILTMDKKLLSQELIYKLDGDVEVPPYLNRPNIWTSRGLDYLISG